MSSESPTSPTSSRSPESDRPKSEDAAASMDGQKNDQDSSSSRQEANHESSAYECNICLDNAKDAVISMCGHLFCWPCLHQWLETRPNRQLCPVCKSAISKDKVIPVYGRGGDDKDPRDKAPPRPQGQRTEPSGSSFAGFNFGDGGNGGLQFSFGIGAFPFTFFGSTLTYNGQPVAAPAPAPGSRHSAEDEYLSRFFLWIAIFFLIWLFLA